MTDAATGQPVAYASVAVLKAAGVPVSGGVGGRDEQFALPGVPPGTYAVRVSFLGYQDFVRPSVVVPAGGPPVALGALPLVAAAQKLGEVVVTARQALVEERVDRTVYHAENDPTTRGGDATNVLRRVPLLSVDLDGNVSLRGDQNIRVLINNKPSTITANGVADGLKQIPADQIQRVEVITSPSAKYDAEGTGGIINIITKTNTLRGGQLGLDGSGGTRSGTLNLNGTYRTGRMGFALGGFRRAGYNTPGSFSNDQLTSNPTTGQQTRTTQAVRTRWPQPTAALASSRAPATSVRNVQTTDESGTVDASLSYTHAYATPQRELSALALLTRNNRTFAFNNNTFVTSSAAQTDASGSDSRSSNQELTAQVDYQTPTGRNQLLEMGAKEIRRTVQSDYT